VWKIEISRTENFLEAENLRGEAEFSDKNKLVLLARKSLTLRYICLEEKIFRKKLLR